MLICYLFCKLNVFKDIHIYIYVHMVLYVLKHVYCIMLYIVFYINRYVYIYVLCMTYVLLYIVEVSSLRPDIVESHMGRTCFPHTSDLRESLDAKSRPMIACENYGQLKDLSRVDAALKVTRYTSCCDGGCSAGDQQHQAVMCRICRVL